MRDIFISWGSPDREVVVRLTNRLLDLGLDLWEYSHDMEAGDDIPDAVLGQINDSRLAVVCLSDQSAQRPWMQTEAAWLYAAKGDPNRSLQHIVPVKVGELAPANVPQLIGQNQYVFDYSQAGDGGEEELERLVKDIQKRLGKDAPLVMPAALFAMNQAQSESFFENLDSRNAPGLWQLCRLVGMENPPQLFNFLAGRYGETPYDLRPFASDQKLLDILSIILRDINRSRAREGRRPIFLRWLTEELTGPPSDARQEARDYWSKGDSLLIVDSVSTLHPEVAAKIAAVPRSDDPSRAALLWVPPYTQHTGALEDWLRQSAQFAPSLGDVFARWEEQPRRAISFDTSTQLAVRLWLRRALAEVNDELSPRHGNVVAMPPPGGWSASPDGPVYTPPPPRRPTPGSSGAAESPASDFPSTGKLRRFLSSKS